MNFKREGRIGIRHGFARVDQKTNFLYGMMLASLVICEVPIGILTRPLQVRPQVKTKQKDNLIDIVVALSQKKLMTKSA